MISPWTPFSFLNLESSPPPCVFGRFCVPKKLFCLVDGVVCSAEPAGKNPSYVLKPVLAFSSNSFCSFIYVFLTSYRSKMAFSSSSSANCPFLRFTAELVKTEEPYFMLALKGEAAALTSLACIELVRFYLCYFGLPYKYDYWFCFIGWMFWFWNICFIMSVWSRYEILGWFAMARGGRLLDICLLAVRAACWFFLRFMLPWP